MEDSKQYFNTRYGRLPDLLIDLEIARTDGNYKKVMAKYSNPVVLILDEWLLRNPTDSEQRNIFELLHRRRKKSSTISAHSTNSRNSTNNLVEIPVLWQMHSLTASHMTVIESISPALMPNTTFQCARSLD